MSEIKGSHDNFEQEVLKSELPVIVDFWAEWCGPCKIIGPVLHELSEQYAGKMKLVKVNVDENQELTSQYGVMSIPTMKFFKGGQDMGEIVGAAPKHLVESKLQELL